jgi:D-glycerate 3-kinase
LANTDNFTEHALIKRTGSGMTNEEVFDFILNYYPAYELYLENLRKGIMWGEGRHLRLVVNKARKVTGVETK